MIGNDRKAIVVVVGGHRGEQSKSRILKFVVDPSLERMICEKREDKSAKRGEWYRHLTWSGHDLTVSVAWELVVSCMNSVEQNLRRLILGTVDCSVGHVMRPEARALDGVGSAGNGGCPSA